MTLIYFHWRKRWPRCWCPVPLQWYITPRYKKKQYTQYTSVPWKCHTFLINYTKITYMQYNILIFSFALSNLLENYFFWGNLKWFKHLCGRYIHLQYHSFGHWPYHINDYFYNLWSNVKIKIFHFMN